MHRLGFILTIVLALPAGSRGQVSIADSSISMALLSLGYGGYAPAGDLSSRMGFASLLGGEAAYKHRSGLYVSLGGYVLFSDRVKNPPDLSALGFSYLYTSGSQTALDYGHPDENGNVHLPRFSIQGFSVPFRLGFLFNTVHFSRRENPNSGLVLEAGAQFLQHRVNIRFDSEKLPYNSREALRGYDRLTNGIGPVLAVGYRFFSNNRFVNAYLMLEAGLHFTQSRRSLDWDTNTVDDQARRDLLVGFRAGWMLPMYRVAPEKAYYW